MVALGGEKMSKSKGNLVFVSRLTADFVDPRAIRLALLAHHYRSDWEWSDAELTSAIKRLEAWRAWAHTTTQSGSGLVEQIRGSLAQDLDTASALAVIDAAVAAGGHPTNGELDSISALLGIELRETR